MNNKKWIKYWLYILLILPVIYAINYIVNPSQVFDHNILSNYKLRYYPENSIQKYEMLRNGKYSLVFGTSRSHLISSKMINSPMLNLHSIYGNPFSVMTFLSQLSDKQISNVKEIFYLIDLHAFNDKKIKDKINFKDYSHLKYTVKNLHKINIVDLYENIKINNTKNNLGYINQEGSQVYVNSKQSYHINELKNINKIDNQEYSQQDIEEIGRVDKFCKKNNIKITYFTPTFDIPSLLKLDLEKEKNKLKDILNQGIDSIQVLYYIDSISNLEKDNRYLGFARFAHLNYFYQNIIVDKYILKDSDFYKVYNMDDLDKIMNYKELN